MIYYCQLQKNCETLIDQTHRKAEETLEFKIDKSRKTFHFNPPISKGRILDDRDNESRCI